MKSKCVAAIFALAFFLLSGTVFAVSDIFIQKIGDYSAQSHCENNIPYLGLCYDYDSTLAEGVDGNSSICFLDYVMFEDLDTGEEWGFCKIEENDKHHYYIVSYAVYNSDAWCRMSCWSWSDIQGFDLFKKTKKDVQSNDDKTIDCDTGVKCTKHNSFCGLDLVMMKEIDTEDDDNTYCKLYLNANNEWVIGASDNSDAGAICGASCIYWGNLPEDVKEEMNFSSDIVNYVEFRSKKNAMETAFLVAPGTNACTLSKVHMWGVRDKGDKTACSIELGIQNIRGDTAYGDDDENKYVDCTGHCLTWKNLQLSNLCGNGIHEPPNEDCDLGAENGPESECSSTCKSNYCEGQTFVNTCADESYNPGMLCHNVNGEIVLVPNCAGQFGEACDDCGIGKVCDLGTITQDMISEDHPLYNKYVPLDTGFGEDERLPKLELIDSAQGEGYETNQWGNRISYQMVKNNEAGKLRFYFTFPVENGKTYVAEAYVKTIGTVNESVKIYGSSSQTDYAESRFAKPGTAVPDTAWDTLSYEFVAPSSSYTLNIEVNKRGTYYIDDVSVKKLDEICQPRCTITEAYFNDVPSADYGTEITATVRFTGACRAPFFVQIDASSIDGSCKMEHDNPGTGGFISGLDFECTRDDITTAGIKTFKCTKKWTVPHVPEACAGKTVSSTFAGLWKNDIGSGGTQIAQLTILNPNTIRFVSEPIPETCGNGQLDDNEECDNSFDPSPKNCSEVNNTYVSGKATCKNNCKYDPYLCERAEKFCGDSVVQKKYGEQCDTNNLTNMMCSDISYAEEKYYSGGTLRCYAKDTENECRFDTSACTKPVVCGDGVRDAGEECDGEDFGEIENCNDINSNLQGTLGCIQATCKLDTSSCQPIGCNGDSPNGVCEMAYETRSSCPEDCVVELRNIVSERIDGDKNLRFSADASSEYGNVRVDTFLVCEYANGFSNRQSCINLDLSDDCGINSVTGEISDCICGNMINECRLLCFDVSGRYYIYAEGMNPADVSQVYRVQSDKKSFYCPFVGISNLTYYKDSLIRVRQRAYSNWHDAIEQGLPTADIWKDITIISDNTVAMLVEFINRLNNGESFTESQINLIINQVRGAFARINELNRMT